MSPIKPGTRILIVVTARKGSSFKGKNYYPTAGKPMIDYTIEAAKSAECTFKSTLDMVQIETLMSTDCHHCEAAAESHEMRIDKRQQELSGNHATLNQVMTYIAKKYTEYTHYVCLAPTSPLRTGKHVKDSIEQYLDQEADSLLSVTEERKGIWNKPEGGLYGRPLYLPLKNRQDIEPVYVANGAIFITSRQILLSREQRTGGRVSLFVMSTEDSVDVHTAQDVELAEFYLQRRKG